MDTLVPIPSPAETSALHSTFRAATPFPHLVVENFLPETLARSLLEQFPPFPTPDTNSHRCFVGGKATFENMKELGPAYRELDAYFASPEFLDWMSRLTGIPDLLYDPEYYGGGTHENLPGQDMSLHVDFNFHPNRGLHRRVNVLIYLNPEWEESWGGSIELWQNPWDPPSKNSVAKVAPLWNRMLVFPTTETSWHGFEPVKIPAHSGVSSRRSIAIYLYSQERPAQEIGAMHSTIYYERPLPESIRPEKVISKKDWDEMHRLTARRDGLLQLIYGREAKFNTLLLDLARQVRDRDHQLAALGATPGDLHAQLPSATEKLQETISTQKDVIRALLDRLRAPDLAPTPIQFAPSETNVHSAVAGFWQLLQLGVGVRAIVKREFKVRPRTWALIRSRESERLQLVFLAREFSNFYLAHQAASPGSILVSRSALYAEVVALENQLGEKILLPEELRTRWYSLLLAWFTLLTYFAKNSIFGDAKSPWLWRAAAVYRRVLRIFGLHLPLVPPHSS